MKNFSSKLCLSFIWVAGLSPVAEAESLAGNTTPEVTLECYDGDQPSSECFFACMNSWQAGFPIVQNPAGGAPTNFPSPRFADGIGARRVSCVEYYSAGDRSRSYIIARKKIESTDKDIVIIWSIGTTVVCGDDERAPPGSPYFRITRFQPSP